LKKKYYAVAVGRRSGIYHDWPTAEAQVKGFAGAKYKSFPTEEEAEAWLRHPEYGKKLGSDRRQASVQPSPPLRPGAISVCTDGGCSNNPGPGGYGIVIDDNGERREESGGYRHTTNNRMEMMAAIIALESLRDCTKAIDLYSDSSYLVNGINKGWAEKWRTNFWRKADGGPVQNVDLWQRLLAMVDILDVRFHWLKGHAGHEGNERCDQLAVAAIRQTGLAVDGAYEDAAGGEENNGERAF